MEDLILHPDIAEPVMTLSDRDMGTLFKALMIYRWRGEEPKDLSAAADMAFIFIRTKMDMETEARKEYCRKQQEIKLIFLSFLLIKVLTPTYYVLY